MDVNQAEQTSRIIEDVFKYEEQVDPRTISLMFKLIRNLLNNINYANPNEDEGGIT